MRTCLPGPSWFSACMTACLWGSGSGQCQLARMQLSGLVTGAMNSMPVCCSHGRILGAMSTAYSPMCCF